MTQCPKKIIEKRVLERKKPGPVAQEIHHCEWLPWPKVQFVQFSWRPKWNFSNQKLLLFFLSKDKELVVCDNFIFDHVDMPISVCHDSPSEMYSFRQALDLHEALYLFASFAAFISFIGLVLLCRHSLRGIVNVPISKAGSSRFCTSMSRSSTLIIHKAK